MFNHLRFFSKPEVYKNAVISIDHKNGFCNHKKKYT